MVGWLFHHHHAVMDGVSAGDGLECEPTHTMYSCVRTAFDALR